MTKKELKKIIQECINEMNLIGLSKQPRDPFDPTDIDNPSSFDYKTKTNPFDDKEFAMSSKVLSVMSNYIDREKGTFVKDGISVTQKLIDELVKSIGNLDLNGVKSSITKLDLEWNLIKNKYPSINKKYVSFKNELLANLK